RFVSLCLLRCSADRRDLHSFPTRRSSDLPAGGDLRADRAARAGPVAAAAVGVGGGGAGPADRADGGQRRDPGPLGPAPGRPAQRSEEHTSELQSRENLVCRLLLEKKKQNV